MNDIKFCCPRCGQHLAVDANGAGATVPCPQCGQAIIVPTPARMDKPGKPARVKGRLLFASGIFVALLVAGLIVWLMLGHNNASADPDSAVNINPATPASVSAAGKTLNKGLVLRMTFDRDETDGTVTDSSGSGNNGRASGVRWTSEGKMGGAYEFTADGDQILIPNNASLNPAHLTLSAWIKTTNADSVWRRIFDKSWTQGFALSIVGDWQQKNWRGLASMETGPGDHFLLTKTRLADGRWHQVVNTFDGTNETFYVDGRFETTFHWQRPGRVGATDFNLVIGCNRSNLTEPDLGTSFRGFIDEPMMWNRALSEQEVAHLFQSQNGSPAGERILQ